MEDATIVATHMILAAADEGVDSCWINFLDPEKMAAALELPENEEVLMVMDLQNMQPVRVHHYEYLVPIFVETAVMKCFTFSEGRFA